MTRVIHFRSIVMRGLHPRYTSSPMKVFAILPAAGLGTRMAAAGSASPNAPKQFLTLAGLPVLVHSLKAFSAVPRVEQIVVAVRKNEIERTEAQVAEYKLAKVRVVEGGDNRQHSVANALAALHAAKDDVVLVHDAVRPLIDPGTIERTIDAVVKHGAAIVALPAVDTIKQVERTADGAIITVITVKFFTASDKTQPVPGRPAG